MPQSEFSALYLDAAMQIATAGGRHPNTGLKIDWRQDAGESAFLERQLESIEAKIYDYKLRELKFRRLFPVSNEGQGSETIAYDIVRGAGIAKIIANGADDLPRADTFVERFYAVVRPVGISFGYTTQELRNAAFSNVPLEARRGVAARRGMEEKLSDIAWNGDSEYNLLGILDNPNIPQSEAADPASGSSTAWDGGDKTALEIIADISGALSDVVETTNQVHEPDTVVLPVAQYEYIRKTPYSTLVPQSILRYLTDPLNGFNIKTIEQAPELKDSGPAGEDQMLVYEKSDEVLTFRIPMELRAMPPEQRNLEFLINMEAECAGMVVRYPLACSFTYGI
jgi:hypothetical protein